MSTRNVRRRKSWESPTGRPRLTSVCHSTGSAANRNGTSRRASPVATSALSTSPAAIATVMARAPPRQSEEAGERQSGQLSHGLGQCRAPLRQPIGEYAVQHRDRVRGDATEAGDGDGENDAPPVRQ